MGQDSGTVDAFNPSLEIQKSAELYWTPAGGFLSILLLRFALIVPEPPGPGYAGSFNPSLEIPPPQLPD